MNAAEERNVIPMPTPVPAAEHQTQAAPTPEALGTGNLEKVRDILFGAQMRDYDRRFARLEERLVKEAADAREDARRRFDTLENFIKQEIAALGDRLRAENHQRTQTSEEITRELRDTTRSLGQRIHELDMQTSQGQRDLREQLLAQAKQLADEIRQKHEEVSSSLVRESREIRHDKADRAALANLFTELALRLNHEFKLPGDE
ncbi:MAG: hypothetical protein JNJ50_30320 [Acidobacteria bacterium]|jgi:DNA anti-recombination protein RmuC|nr:hypothetical protein [Acidobacteriota bacterium]